MFVPKTLLAALLFVVPEMVVSAEPYAPTEDELRLLPSYCEAKLGADKKNDAVQKHWSDVFGPDNWLHMHHYCFGLNFMNRSYRSVGDRKQAMGDLRAAINNFNYILTHTRKDFDLRAEVMVQKARALHLRGEDDEVPSLYLGAIAFKADYIPAYVALGDYYKGLGDAVKARETYEAGLKQNPKSKLLTRRLERLKTK